MGRETRAEQARALIGDIMDAMTDEDLRDIRSGIYGCAKFEAIAESALAAAWAEGQERYREAITEWAEARSVFGKGLVTIAQQERFVLAERALLAVLK